MMGKGQWKGSVWSQKKMALTNSKLEGTSEGNFV